MIIIIILFLGELDGNRAVPFRLTPNLTELITEIGICGPLIASMIATARCFAYPNFKLQAILKALLRDEMITSYKRVKNFLFLNLKLCLKSTIGCNINFLF